MDLSANIFDLRIDPAWGNGSGVFSSIERLKKMMEYDIGWGFAKSTGIEDRPGNLEPTIAQVTEDTFINAMGLPGCGYENMGKKLKKVYPLSKPLVCSVYGSTEDEMVKVAKHLEDYCDAVELNFSCPNIKPGERCGVTIGRDPERVRSFIEAVKNNISKPVIVKLTPSVYDIGEIAGVAEDAGADAISAINTVPGGMVIDVYAKKPVLTAKYGGVSGRGIKGIAIGAIYKIYESVDIPIIGGGGITQPEDIVEFIEAGADVASIATDFREKGNMEIEMSLRGIRGGVESILEELGASSLRELKGAAHG
jgi:dihydroorotate dehydrogenase (NAD+) catalytic subunit